MRVERFRTYSLLLMLIGISLIFFFMIKTFLVAIFLAVMLAGLFYPVYQRLVRWTKGHRSLSAFFCMGCILVICVVPLSIVMMLLANEAFQFYEWVDQQWGILKITERSLEKLESEGVPDDLLEKLESIKDYEVTVEEDFVDMLKATIGEEQTDRFKSLILKHAGQWESLIKDMDVWLERITILDYIDRFNWVEYLQQIDWQDKIGDIAKTVSSFLYQSIRGISKSAFRVAVVLGVMLFTMYYLFKDGRASLDRITYLIPLNRAHTELLISKFVSMIRATIKGTMVIGVIQGIIGGLTLWIFGVGSPVLWGVIMAVLSIIPLAGSTLVWGPAGIIRILTGHIGSGIAILAIGVAIISTIDNVLRPRLVGQDTTMHPLFIFFGTLGGISLFGIVGFLVGPIIAALFVTVWDIYGTEFKEQLEDSNKLAESAIPVEEDEAAPLPPESQCAEEPQESEDG